MSNQTFMRWLTAAYVAIMAMGVFRVAYLAGDVIDMVFASGAVVVILFNVKEAVASSGRAEGD